MRYNIKRWHEDTGKIAEIENCENLEVIKQAVKAIDYAQNFEAKVAGPEEDDETRGTALQEIAKKREKLQEILKKREAKVKVAFERIVKELYSNRYDEFTVKQFCEIMDSCTHWRILLGN